MDNAQLIHFLEPMLNYKVIGVDQNGDVVTSHEAICPELRSFIVARLGALTPVSSYRAVIPDTRYRGYKDGPAALAALLREVADGIDPAVKPEAE